MDTSNAIIPNNSQFPYKTEHSAAVNYIEIIFGTVFYLVSFLTMITIGRDKVLRMKNSNRLIILLNFGYAVSCIGSIVHGGIKLHRSHHGATSILSQQTCYFDNLLVNMGAKIIVDTTFLIALDACLAVFIWQSYTKTGSISYFFAEFFIIISHTACSEVRTYLKSSKELYVSHCSPIDICDKTTLIVITAEYLVIVVFTISLYAILIFWAKMSIHESGKRTLHIGTRHIKSKLKMTMTLSFSMLVYVTTVLLGLIALVLAASVRKAEVVKVTTKISSLCSLAGILNLFIILYRTPEVRQSIVKLFICKAVKVYPIAQLAVARKRNAGVVLKE